MNKIDKLTEEIYNVLTERGVVINPSLHDKVYSKYRSMLDKLVKKISQDFNLHPSIAAIVFERLFEKYYGGKTKPAGFTDESIKQVDNKYVVYPSKGGKRLGTHNTKKAANKQLAAIEISKNKKG